MKKLFAVLLVLAAASSEAQTFSRYLIKFKNKANTPYTFANPSAYLSQRAVERRTRYNIAVDSTDLPLPPAYLDSIRSAGAVIILNVSRWLNQVSIQTTDAAALAKINTYSFVANAAPIAARMGGRTGGRQAFNSGQKRIKKATQFLQPTANFYNYGASFQQVNIHNGEFLHNIGLRGQGMVIGMLDAGFLRYTTLRAFDSINQNRQVLGTYDFVDRESSVVEDDSHGMQAFSVIAANIPSQFVGTAPKAAFYLFRTEDASSEYQIEEHNWVCGAERTDSAGGDVISSSLGYSDGMTDPGFNHTYAEMNGNTTIAARGADLAAKKGLLVVNSAGNQGGQSFRYIATPADGDSVLAVGAVDVNGNAVGFSSYGPSSDGQVKPDVASVGVATVVQTAANTVGVNNGTSFSCPNIAGLATCLWQGFREFNNIQIIQALRQAGHKSSAPDNRVGYGIPDVKKAVLLLLKDFSTTTVTASPCKNTINWTSKDIAGMKYELERKAPGESTFIKIGEKFATATTFSTQRHVSSDSLINLQAGTLTYRIRQVIDTGFSSLVSADYIDTVSVNLAATCTTPPSATVSAEEEYTLLPNPTYANIAVRITTPLAVSALVFRITDSKGSIVMIQKANKPAGTATFTLPLNRLAKGTYYVAIYKGNTLVSTKEFIRL